MGGRTPRILKEFRGNCSLDVQPLSLPTERDNMVVEFRWQTIVFTVRDMLVAKNVKTNRYRCF